MAGAKAVPGKKKPSINATPEIKTVALSSLKQAPYNPRSISPEALAGLRRSLELYGYADLVVANKRTGHVVGGHQRLKVLQAAGIKSAPVVFVDLDTKKERQLNVALNSPAISGDFTPDLEGLIEEFRVDLPEIDFDLLGFADLIDEIPAQDQEEVDEDEVPEPPAVPITKPGDLWILGDHRLICGDSTKPETFARLMGGGKSGLMNTDPPYGVDLSKVKDGIPRPGFKNHQELWGDIQNDGLEGTKLQEFLESVFRSALPHLDHAAWYLWHAHLTQGFFAAAAAAAAANVLLHRQIIWKKPGFVLTRSGMYHWAHEPCFYGWVKGQQPNWYGDKSQTSVWEVGRDDDSGQHPTQKPVALFAIPIQNHTREGDMVLEPFSGSGSQLIAAEQLNRKCRAIEISPRYVDVAVQRWETLTGKKADRESAS